MGKNKKRVSALKIEWAQKLRKTYHIIRVIGAPEYVEAFAKRLDKNSSYVVGNNDKTFYSDGFVNSFSFGGVLVFDTDNKTIANKLLAIIDEKKLNLGGCDVQMNPNFYCILRFDGLKSDDYFLNGRLYQL